MKKQIRLTAKNPHLIGMTLGVIIMLVASSVAVSHQDLMPTFIIDAIAYFLHGCGAIPFMRYIESSWEAITGGTR